MFRFFSLYFILFLFTTLLPLMAELPSDAESAVRYALAHNPEILAARSLITEAEIRAAAAGRLANPEISSEIAGGADYQGRIELAFSQRFPLTSRLRFERQLSQLEVESARLEVREQERRLALAVRSAFYDFAFSREALALSEKQSAIADDFALALQKSSAEGIASTLDAGEAELQAALLQNQQENLRNATSLAAAPLALLLGLPAETRFTSVRLPALPNAVPGKSAPRFRPDLRYAEMALEAGQVDVSLAKASKWEDASIGLFFEGERFRDEPAGIEPEALVGLRFSIPLPLWQDGSAKVAEKTASNERLSLRLKALRLAVKNEVDTAWLAMNARHLAARNAMAKWVPAASRQAEAARAAQERGEMDLDKLFRARERLAEAENAALSARKAYFQAHADWMAALGFPHEKP